MKFSEMFPDPPPGNGRCRGGNRPTSEDRYIWFIPLDGLGEECLDIFSCRRYRLACYGQQIGDYYSEYTLEFYMTPNRRWVRLSGDVWDVGDKPQGEYIESWEEVDPIEVAHELVSRNWLKGKLPQELEKFREYGDLELYQQWRHGDFDDDGEPISRLRGVPSWDRDRKVLSVDGFICREFTRGENYQIKLIEAFDDAGWPSSIRDPFKNESRLNETVKSFNKVTSRRGFKFIRVRRSAEWRFRRPRPQEQLP